MRVFLQGIGLCGPGLDGWQNSQPILSGAAPYVAAPTIVPVPVLLPANERRRAVPTVRLAIGVAAEAVAQSGIEAAQLASVFTSSGGDGETVHAILEVLAASEREVSPTRFHNSVHNAPSGYWTIATGCREPATSLCAFDASFAGGLLEAAALAVTSNRPSLLAAYDLPYPEPLHGVRRIEAPFGMALVLTPASTPGTIAALDIATSEGAPQAMDDAALEALRLGNPAARGLPLLAALARGGNGSLLLDYFPGLPVEVGVACQST
jgi:hypothetical protein